MLFGSINLKKNIGKEVKNWVSHNVEKLFFYLHFVKLDISFNICFSIMIFHIPIENIRLVPSMKLE